MLNRLGIIQRFWFVSVLTLSLFAVAVVIGLFGLKAASDSLKTVYEDRAVPLFDLAKINHLINENYAQVLLGLQHDPNGPLSRTHDHPLSLHTDAVRANNERIDAIWTKYMATYLTEEEKALAADFAAKRKAWLDKLQATVAALERGDFSVPTMSTFLAAEQQEREAAEDVLTALMDLQQRVAKEEYKAAEARYRLNLQIFLLLLVLGVLVTVWTTWSTARRIQGSLQAAGEVVEAISQGDLSRPVPEMGADELGQLLKRLAAMREALRDVVGTVRQNVDRLHQASAELSSAAESTARVSESQSKAASSMAASVEELSVSMDQVEKNAQTARDTTVVQSEEGSRIIHEVAKEIGEIAEAVHATARTIPELEDFSGQISSIVNVIREIADQTNMLALNAAIEAARAGEQGRGFAVVADEVRKLAERTAKSTQEIAEMITKIQQSTQRAAQEMEAGVERVNEGVRLSHQAGNSVTAIRASAEQANRALDEISLALKEQAAAVREIAQMVERVAQGTEENSASVSKTAASARQLAALAGELQAVASRFRL